jgi:hypothetical protein
LQDGDRVALPEPAGPVRVHGQIYEDQDGVVWLGANQHGLVRIAPAAQGQVPQAARWAWPDAPSHLPRTFVSAPDGTLWVAPFVGLWRVRGKEVTIVEPLGLDDPHVNVRALHVDQAGRLWLGLRFHGVAVTSEPDVALPRFVGYSVRDGLASDVVWQHRRTRWAPVLCDRARPRRARSGDAADAPSMRRRGTCAWPSRWLAVNCSSRSRMTAGGFDPEQATTGHGLLNLRRRAHEVRGAFTLTSGAAGTRAALRLPLRG